MQRLIVTSATYRQSSRATPELLQRDPENRLLARGPRFRLPAEMIRDQALAAAGLLVEQIGGPSVKPYQPAGLWKELGGEDYEQDHGEGLYRRSLYTFWKRTAPPPSMVTFDAAGRETCTVRETTDEHAAPGARPAERRHLRRGGPRALAERMMREGGATPGAADRVRRSGWPRRGGRRPDEAAILSTASTTSSTGSARIRRRATSC